MNHVWLYINLGIALHQEGYDVVVVDADLGMPNVGELLGVQPEHTVHDVLSDIVKTLRDRCEVVLVDTSSGILHETTVAMGVADGILLVTTASDVAAYDVEKVAQLADRVDGTIIGAVLTRVRDDSNVDGIHHELGVPVLGAVPYDPSFTSANSAACSSVSVPRGSVTVTESSNNQ
jgi:septum site-determining protein MinD